MECYLDNSATTAVSPEVAALVYHMMTEEFGNPSSLHHRGFAAERAMAAARSQVAAVLHAHPEEIVFTSGGTESNNIALLGAAHARRRRGNRIVTTAIEHHSVLAAAEALQAEGFEVIFVKPDATGSISPESFAAACNEKTILASCMMVNSETGAVNDIAAIAAAARRKNKDILFHTDCVQAFCKLDLNPAKWGVQLVSVSGHKIHAPKGTGALYVAKGVHLVAPLFGSPQEKGLRPGTENVPGICGLGLAAERMSAARVANTAHFAALRQRLITNLSQNADVCINSPADAAPYIVNLSVAGIRSEIMIHYLEQFGIYVSSGSACAKGAKSHVLTAMGLSDDRIDSAVRVSMTDTTTEAEIDEFCRRVEQATREITKKR